MAEKKVQKTELNAGTDKESPLEKKTATTDKTPVKKAGTSAVKTPVENATVAADKAPVKKATTAADKAPVKKATVAADKTLVKKEPTVDDKTSVKITSITDNKSQAKKASAADKASSKNVAKLKKDDVVDSVDNVASDTAIAHKSEATPVEELTKTDFIQAEATDLVPNASALAVEQKLKETPVVAATKEADEMPIATKENATTTQSGDDAKLAEDQEKYDDSESTDKEGGKKKKKRRKLSKKYKRKRRNKIIITICILIPILIAAAIFGIGKFVPVKVINSGAIKNVEKHTNAVIPSYMPKGTQKTTLNYYAFDKGDELKLFETMHPISRQYVDNIVTTIDAKDAVYTLTITQKNIDFVPKHYLEREVYKDKIISFEVVEGKVFACYSTIINAVIKEASKETAAAPKEDGATAEGGGGTVEEAILTKDFRFIYNFEISSDKGKSTDEMIEEARKVFKSVIDKQVEMQNNTK